MRVWFIVGCLPFLNLAFEGCWQKQEHALTPPPIPFYELSGKVEDIDTGAALPGVELVLRMLESYDGGAYPGGRTVTDSHGHFRFQEVYRGRYRLSAKRDGYVIDTIEVGMIQYADKSITLSLPKVLWAETSLLFEFQEVCLGLAFRGDTLYLLTTDGYWRKLYRSSATEGFVLVGAPLSIRELNGLTFDGTFLRSSGLVIDTVKTHPTPITRTVPKLFRIDPSTAGLVGSAGLPLLVKALDWDGQNFWAVTSEETPRVLYMAGLNLAILREFPKPWGVKSWEGIAWDGSNLWISDPEKQLIYKHDTEFSIRGTYRPVESSGKILSISQVTFSGPNALWGYAENRVWKFVMNLNR